jgi:hypothetical protein
MLPRPSAGVIVRGITADTERTQLREPRGSALNDIVSLIVNGLVSQMPSDFVLFLLGSAFGAVRERWRARRSKDDNNRL